LIYFFGTVLATGMWCDIADNTGTSGSLQIPSGFCIRKFASPLCPRTLDVLPNGDVLVGSPSTFTPGDAPSGIGGAYILSDSNLDGVADELTQLFVPDANFHGLRFVGDALYYSTASAIWSVPFSPGQRSIPSTAAPVMIADLSAGSVRFTHTIDYDPEADTLYATVGRYEGADCPSANPAAGAVYAIGYPNPMTGLQVVSGCRNPMYMR
jgi:glucose/arabinose dehydrogenase